MWVNEEQAFTIKSLVIRNKNQRVVSSVSAAIHIGRVSWEIVFVSGGIDKLFLFFTKLLNYGEHTVW